MKIELSEQKNNFHYGIAAGEIIWKKLP